MKELKIGIFAEKTLEVHKELTAKAVGSGSLAVFGTPCMLALMEEACCLCAAPYLEADETTVGTAVRLTHNAPTVIGKCVTAKARLTQVQGRQLTFQVWACAEGQEIGTGEIERFLVNGNRFMEKAGSK